MDINDPNKFTTVEVGSNARQFTVTGLIPESAYVFQITARTQKGWGPPEEAIVITTEKRGMFEGLMFDCVVIKLFTT